MPASTASGAAAPAATRVGFIGLGVMGTPMAGHLAAAGCRVRIFDRDAERARALAGSDIEVAASLREVAAGAEVVITMLPDGEAVGEVVAGANGIGQAMTAGSLLLDTSSSEPWLTRRTAQLLGGRGIAMVDAPVSGAQWGAQAAELVFMVGGAADDVARVRPLLQAMGRAIHHVGPLGAGHTMKCINNMITAMTFIATAEGLAVGKRAGLDPMAMNDVLNQSTGASWLTRNHFAQRIFSRSFDDPFKLDLMLKDVGIGMSLAQEQGQPLPLSAVGQQLYRAAARAAAPASSVSEMVRWIEQLTGVELAAGDAKRNPAGPRSEPGQETQETPEKRQDSR